jgi:hypothetical protein
MIAMSDFFRFHINYNHSAGNSNAGKGGSAKGRSEEDNQRLKRFAGIVGPYNYTAAT